MCRLPVSLFNCQSADSIPLPYNIAVCRKTLYQLLLTLLMTSFSWKPSPDQVLLKTFSLGINDQDIEVCFSVNYVVLSCNTRCSQRWKVCSRCRHLVISSKQLHLSSDWCCHLATWQTGWNIHVNFDFRLFPPLYRNMISSTKPEVHNVLALPSEEDQATVTCNMCRKFG